MKTETPLVFRTLGPGLWNETIHQYNPGRGYVWLASSIIAPALTKLLPPSAATALRPLERAAAKAEAASTAARLAFRVLKRTLRVEPTDRFGVTPSPLALQ